MKVLRFYAVVALLSAAPAVAGLTTALAQPILAPTQHRPPPPPDPLHIIKGHPRPPARRHPPRLHIKLPHIKLPPRPAAPPHP